MNDTLKNTVLTILGPTPTAAQRRAVAQELRDLAAAQDHLADAMERAPTDRPSFRRTGRRPGVFVRIDRTYRTDVPAILIGRGLYYDLALADPSGTKQPPPRMDVRQVEGHIQLIGLWSEEGGYAVTVGAGMPRFYAAGSRDLFAPFVDGRYAATVEGDRITLSTSLTATTPPAAQATVERTPASTPMPKRTLAPTTALRTPRPQAVANQVHATISWNDRQYTLSIAETLLERLNYPKVLIVERRGQQGLILYQRGDARATANERKVNYPLRAMPRIKIGAEPAAGLGLRQGRYRAWVEQDAILAERTDQSSS